jgi:amino acid transporter
MSGAVLTFYAFVGFEDLLNLAEEVKNPQRTMPCV